MLIPEILNCSCLDIDFASDNYFVAPRKRLIYRSARYCRLNLNSLSETGYLLRFKENDLDRLKIA